MKQVQHDIRPATEIARGLVIQSTNEYPSFLKGRNDDGTIPPKKFCSAINFYN